MKKLVVILTLILVIMSNSLTVLAGDVPESLLNSDNAQIFFAEVVAYHPDKENSDIEILPVKKIKGDVKIGTRQSAYNPNTVGDFDIKVGNVYLFTYLDENNPTDIFEVTSYDTSALKLKNVEGGMWERLEQYLNEGRYLDAEQARLDKQNELSPIEGEDISLVELLGVSREEAETVNIYYNGEVHEIGANDFYTAIDGIILTDIENVSLEKRNGDTVSFPNGMYITVNGFDGYAFITDDCKVDKYGLHHSDMPNGEYTIKFVDRAKITALFADDEYKLPPIETPFSGRIFRISVLIVIILGIVAIIGLVLKEKKGNYRKDCN